MEIIQLSPSELVVMRAIWQVWNGKDPLSTKDFVPLFRDKGWDRSAYFSFLRRLESKGMLKAERSPESRRENIYLPLVTEQAYLHMQNWHFIKEVHGGFQPFFAALVNDPDLSQEAVTGMQKALNELNT